MVCMRYNKQMRGSRGHGSDAGMGSLAQKVPVHAGIRTGLLVSDEESLDGASGTLPKGKIEIVLRKSDQFESLVAGGAAAQRMQQRAARTGGGGPEEATPS